MTSPGEGTFHYNFCTEVDLVATPERGYRFVAWGGGGASIEDVTSSITKIISVNGKHRVRASFEPIPPPELNLTVSSTSGGSVTAPGEGTSSYSIGVLVYLVATPVSGYRFVSWTGDVGTIADITSPTATINMQGSYSIVARFEPIPPVMYNLAVSSTAGGSVISPGQGTLAYTAGAVVNLVASPANGYRFLGWTGNVGTMANPGAASTTITMLGNYAVTATFEPIPAVPYNLVVSSGIGGSVTSPGQGTFAYLGGTVVNLVASPASGYTFVNWTGSVGTIASPGSASTTITMLGNYSITANFAPVQAVRYTLTIFSGTCGSVTQPGEGVFTYDVGTVVTLVAAPVTRYRFVNWSGDVTTIANVNSASTTITMYGNYSITANFERIRRVS